MKFYDAFICLYFNFKIIFIKYLSYENLIMENFILNCFFIISNKKLLGRTALRDLLLSLWK